MAHPKIKCPVCGRQVAITDRIKIWPHRIAPHELCPGAGRNVILSQLWEKT